MKIITASKFYYHRAGLEAYLFKITDLLQSKGHEIIPFSTNYIENIQTDYDAYFPDYIGIGGEDRISLFNKIKAFSNIIYNSEARKSFSRLLDDTKPDIVWGFGIHRHLSPSIFMEAQKKNIPVIHRLSDYSIICPDSRLTKGDNTICSELLCPTRGFHHAVINRCVRQSSNENPSKEPSIAASVVGAIELAIHHNFKSYINNVDTFIAPSNFLRHTMIKAGIPQEKIVHIPIFIDVTKYTPKFDSEDYLLYFGRLSREKGLPLLLEVMSELKEIKLLIVGEGPQREYLEKIKEERNLDNVLFLGKLYGEELHRVVRNSRAVIVPSTWFENSPNVILESYAMGKPVIAADIGGIPELVEEGETGYLYKFNNKEELINKISLLTQNKAVSKTLGINARNYVEKFFNKENHYDQVIAIMNQTMESVNVRS